MAMLPVERQETIGPGWKSVQELVTTITNHHKLMIEVGVKFSYSRGAGQYAYWTVAAWRVAPIVDRVHVQSVVRGWPHPDHKTVPGMLTGMLYDLDEKLARIVWQQGKLAL